MTDASVFGVSPFLLVHSTNQGERGSCFLIVLHQILLMNRCDSDGLVSMLLWQPCPLLVPCSNFSLPRCQNGKLLHHRLTQAVFVMPADSETTEDEGGDQFETKEDRGDAEDQAVHGGNPSVFLHCVPPGFVLDLLLLLPQPSDVYQQHVQVLRSKTLNEASTAPELLPGRF